jgi:hypothetical protein
MRSRISLPALIAVVCIAAPARAADWGEYWPQQILKLDKAALASRLGVLDQEIRVVHSMNSDVLDPLLPALQFQKAFLQAVSGAPASIWRAEMERLAALPGSDAVADAVRETARVWQARLMMSDIDGALRVYYRRQVRFPATLAEIENSLPQNLLKDPWGEPWIYKPGAPQGFERLGGQRYRLAPARFPDITPLPDAATCRTPQSHPWTISLREAAGRKSLEFHSSENGASSAIIEPGGKVGGCTLLFIGDGWALMAGVDQLFAVEFHSP